MQRYVCFDVETPNLHNDRMSAIGICVVEDGRTVDRFYSVVNPDAEFDAFNIRLTGITPQMAEESPNFSQLWKTLSPLLRSGLLVAHNAQFDMSVLSKCLMAYEIDCPETTRYLCTCRMSKAAAPSLSDHKLDTVCRALHIPLDHHNALSDANACAEILKYCIKSGTDAEGFIRGYNLWESRTLKGAAAAV